MQVNPMPRIRWQVLKPGLPLGVVDLNCGWYCLRAVYEFWHKTRRGIGFGDEFRHSRIPKDRWARRAQLGTGYDPRVNDDDVTERDYRELQPDFSHWLGLLVDNGPIIACGRLGAADWGAMRVGGERFEFGVGHYILIVGIRQRGGRTYLLYKDPLQGERMYLHERVRGERIIEGELGHMNKRIGFIQFVSLEHSHAFVNRFNPE